MSLPLKKIIYSVYVDIPEKELDEQPPHHDSNISKTLHTKLEFKKHYAWLKERHESYAKSIGVDYILFEYDKELEEYVNSMPPEITAYNALNFYKIKKLYDLSKEYDEILYLDFDVIPITTENFFEAWDLDKGIVIMEGTAESQKQIGADTEDLYRQGKRAKQSNRSPVAKYWNTRAMLSETELGNGTYTVFNTGIIGANKKHLQNLDYFGEFNENLKLMKELHTHEMYPTYISQLFGYDNETLWGFKILGKELPWQDMKETGWHHFVDKWNYIPKDTKLVHMIKKDFDFIKEYCEKNNI